MGEVETTSIVNSKAYIWLSLCSSAAGLWYLALAGEEQTTRYNKATHYMETVYDFHRAKPHPIQGADLFAAPHVTNIYLAAPNTVQFFADTLQSFRSCTCLTFIFGVRSSAGNGNAVSPKVESDQMWRAGVESRVSHASKTMT